MVGMKPDYPHSQHKMFGGKSLECSLFTLTIDLTLTILSPHHHHHPHHPHHPHHLHHPHHHLTILTTLMLNRRRGRTNGEEEVEG